LAKQLQKRRISKISQSETRVAYGRNEKWGPSIDASYQVSVHLAEGF
jgi:hypothetical protein